MACHRPGGGGAGLCDLPGMIEWTRRATVEGCDLGGGGDDEVSGADASEAAHALEDK